MLQFEGKFRVPENYLSAFKQAELTFLHQRVYCPKKQELVLLTEPDPTVDIETMPYIGSHVDADMARAIAVGDVNPIAKQPIILPGIPEKRRVGPLQSATGSQTRSLGKPIDSFFKAHRRIPLGEMDPNCFSVESRRQSSATQEEAPPIVFPLPRPYIDGSVGTNQSPNASRPYTTSKFHRRQTEPFSRRPLGQQASVPSNARRRTAGPMLRSSGDGHHTRPQKKARLCEDTVSDELTDELPEKSKFFPPRPKRSTVRRQPDALLRSDDSIEDALRSLPDVDSWNTTKPSQTPKSAEIFRDDVPTPTSEPAPARNSPGSGEDVHVEHSESIGGDGVSPTKTPGRSALRQYVYNSNGSSAVARTRIVHGLPTPASDSQGSSSKAPALQLHTPLATPLQRMGAQALQRSERQTTPLSMARKPEHLKTKRHSFEKALAGLPLNPSFVPLPKVDLAEVEALNRPLGSEDEIIPDSDGENEPEFLAEAGMEDSSAPTSSESLQERLNLSRFLYT